MLCGRFAGRITAVLVGLQGAATCSAWGLQGKIWQLFGCGGKTFGARLENSKIAKSEY
jgi:hypothetical protein